MRIISIRAIARKNNINHMKLWRLFKIYVALYGDDPRYVIVEYNGKRRPTEEFVRFVENALGIKLKL
ncbi:hypothetical protein [Pyrococcus kukulkanii]|uniref:Transcriptional regulator n=1 Tax=Pyrococcus kukulkanii TaxID=1609559 RepID=A0ABV4T9L0_9EURY